VWVSASSSPQRRPRVRALFQSQVGRPRPSALAGNQTKTWRPHADSTSCFSLDTVSPGSWFFRCAQRICPFLGRTCNRLGWEKTSLCQWCWKIWVDEGNTAHPSWCWPSCSSVSYNNISRTVSLKETFGPGWGFVSSQRQRRALIASM
jgi:hypothetical protein